MSASKEGEGDTQHVLLFKEIRRLHLVFSVLSNGDVNFYPCSVLQSTASHTTVKGTSATLLSSSDTVPVGAPVKDLAKDEFRLPPPFCVTVERQNAEFVMYDVLVGAPIHTERIPLHLPAGRVAPDYLRPRRVELSSEGKHLLVLDGDKDKTAALLIYRIESSKPHLRLVYSDLSSIFSDVCFSFTSDYLYFLLVSHPTRAFLMPIPVTGVNDTDLRPKRSKKKKNAGSDLAPILSPIFAPESISPVISVGSVTSALGGKHKMDCICNLPKEKWNYREHSFVTCDSAAAEFCIWSVRRREDSKEDADHEFIATHSINLLIPSVVDRQWAEDLNSPMQYILRAEACENAIAFLVQRENYKNKELEDGIGIEVVNLNDQSDIENYRLAYKKLSAEKGVNAELPVSPMSMKSPLVGASKRWFRIGGLDPSEVLQFGWSNTLWIGSCPSVAAIVDGQGIFEFLEGQYQCRYTGKSSEFTASVRSFLQISRQERLWLAAGTNELHAVVIDGDTSVKRKELADIVKRKRDVNYSVYATRLGYTQVDECAVDPVHVTEVSYKKKSPKVVHAPALESLIHESYAETANLAILPRCYNCSVALVRPLMCSRCGQSVFCSVDCQHASPCCQ